MLARVALPPSTQEACIETRSCDCCREPSPQWSAGCKYLRPSDQPSRDHYKFCLARGLRSSDPGLDQTPHANMSPAPHEEKFQVHLTHSRCCYPDLCKLRHQKQSRPKARLAA